MTSACRRSKTTLISGEGGCVSINQTRAGWCIATKFLIFSTSYKSTNPGCYMVFHMCSGEEVLACGAVKPVVIKVIRGDITKEMTDAIVNSTDSRLSFNGEHPNLHGFIVNFLCQVVFPLNVLRSCLHCF